MKKTYTRKQIREAIAYWEKRLAEGNYRKLGEARKISPENCLRVYDEGELMDEYEIDRTVEDMVEALEDSGLYDEDVARISGGDPGEPNSVAEVAEIILRDGTWYDSLGGREYIADGSEPFDR